MIVSACRPVTSHLKHSVQLLPAESFHIHITA